MLAVTRSSIAAALAPAGMVDRDTWRFARAAGFKIEDDLNTEKSRRLWLEWKRRVDPVHYLDPKARVRIW